MNIILSQSIISDAVWNQNSFPPLGLLYVAASVSNLPGVNVHIVDGYNEGLSIDRTVERIIALEPDILGMSMTSQNFLEGLEVIRTVKEMRPNVITACGGIHASMFDDLLLRENPALDLVFRGEAEESFPEMVKRVMAGASLEDGIPGMSHRVNGRLVRGETQVIDNLDGLPFPQRSLLKEQYYTNQYYGFDLPQLPRTTTAFSSRGCPYSCIFCSDVTIGSKFRTRSEQSILEELLEIKGQGYEFVIFFDDNFTGDVERVNRVCRLIIENKVGLFLASTGMPYLLPDETLQLMSKAGFIVMFVGVESGSDHMLKIYRKPARRKMLVDGIKRAQKNNIVTIASFVTGHREETDLDHQLSKSFIRLVKPYFCEINPLMVHPGSTLWREIHADQPDLKLENTRSRLISRFPGQMDKKTIKIRETDFRKCYQSLWRNWRMWAGFVGILHRSGFGPNVAKKVWKNPSSVLRLIKSLLQLLRGGRSR